MLTAAFLSAGLGLAAARIEFPRVTLEGRRLLEMSFEELPFPQGQVQHEAATADSVVVDGVAYATECAPSIPSSSPVHSVTSSAGFLYQSTLKFFRKIKFVLSAPVTLPVHQH